MDKIKLLGACVSIVQPVVGKLDSVDWEWEALADIRNLHLPEFVLDGLCARNAEQAAGTIL